MHSRTASNFGGAPSLRPGTFEAEHRKLRLILLTFALVLIGPLVFLVTALNQNLVTEALQREISYADILGASIQNVIDINLIKLKATNSQVSINPDFVSTLYKSVGATLLPNESNLCLYLVQDNKVISTLRKNSETRSEEITLYRKALNSFPNAELVISVAELKLGKLSRFAYLLVAVICSVCVIGLLGIYFIARKQLELAEQRSNFVSSVSHELKTPVTAIRMHAEMLSSGWIKEEEKRSQYFSSILSESERLSHLVGNVLQFATLEQALSTLELKSINLKEILSRAEKIATERAKLAGFSVEMVLPKDDSPEAFSVLINAEALDQVLSNLVDNSCKFAAKYAPNKIQLGYRIEQAGRDINLIIFIRDFGPGIALGKEQKIFEPFYRVEDEMTRKTPGTGIGLALVKALAQRMGAKVRALNLKPGAEFQLIFGQV